MGFGFWVLGFGFWVSGLAGGGGWGLGIAWGGFEALSRFFLLMFFAWGGGGKATPATHFNLAGGPFVCWCPRRSRVLKDDGHRVEGLGFRV